MTDIYEKIEQYSEFCFGLDAIEAEKKQLIDSVIPPEIKDKLAEIDAEFAQKSESIQAKKTELEAEIKAEVLEAGRSVKGTYHSFVWSKPRVSWDDKGLSGYALHHPEILQFRKVGNPSVSVRKA
jgi:hypothetical protein